MPQSDTLHSIVGKLLTRLKNRWQVFFLPGAVFFSLSLMHQLNVRPALRPALQPYLNTIDLVSFFIAGVLAILVFNIKRRYFSFRYTRMLLTQLLQENPQYSDDALIVKIFAKWNEKLTLVWLLGLLIMLDGVVFYWLTFSPGNNLLIYFIIGAFSMVLNYPRRDWFEEIPWQIVEARRELSTENRSGS